MSDEELEGFCINFEKECKECPFNNTACDEYYREHDGYLPMEMVRSKLMYKHTADRM